MINMVTSEDRILTALELGDPIDRIPKMELFASLFPQAKFLLNWEYIPYRIKRIVRRWNFLEESIDTMRENFRMKPPKPGTTRYGRIIRSSGLLKKILSRIRNDLENPKPPSDPDKADKDAVSLAALSYQMPIKLGYDLWSAASLQSPDITISLSKAPDGNYYFKTSEGQFSDINSSDLELLPKGIDEPDFKKQIEHVKEITNSIDIDHFARNVEKLLNTRFRMRKIKDQIVPCILSVGILETWLTVFGNWNMQGFFREVMKEFRNGCKGPYFDLLKIKADYISKSIKRLSEIDGYKVHIIGDDSAHIHGSFLKPKVFKEFIAIHTKKAIDTAHKYNVKVIFHSDGNFKVEGTDDPEKKWEFMNAILGTGVDAWHPVEMFANDIEEMKREVGDKICLCNGINTIELQNGTRQSVALLTKNILDKVYRGGGNRLNGYIIGSDNSLMGGVQIPLVKQMLYTADEYSRRIIKS